MFASVYKNINTYPTDHRDNSFIPDTPHIT